MSGDELPPSAGQVEVSELLNSIASRQRILDQRLAELASWTPPADAQARRLALQTARGLREDARRLRASVDAVQTFLRERRAAVADSASPSPNLRKPS